MKLREMREHYRTTDNGVTWIAKVPFKSKREIRRKLGYDPRNCVIYTCGVCSSLHLASPYSMRKKSNVTR